MESPERPFRSRTSVSIYAGDLAKLKKKQLQISSVNDEWVPMFDIIHALIARLEYLEGEQA